MNTLDEKDQAILKGRIAVYERNPGPRVGDVLRMANGELRRFTHDWGDDIQVTLSGSLDQSFYFGDGYMSFSGGLDRARPKSKMVATGETKEVMIWFFHHDWQRANGGVYSKFPARVFEEK